VRLPLARLPRQAGEPAEKDYREWEYWGTTTRKQGGYKKILMPATIEEQFKNISGTFLAHLKHFSIMDSSINCS
jgi:hypothetical protein